ncbi:MAG: hypothetical protein ACD_39C01108G0001 [uncultured bacterium]|nr:MAG: hypothetical protein ACD_39C01108G0001 [uncultured bacterium]
MIIKAFRRLLPVVFILLAISMAGAVDLDRPFAQVIDSSFFAGLRDNEGVERAIFVELAGSEKVFYLRYAHEKYIMRGNLDRNEEKLLIPLLTNSRTTTYAPCKQNGEPLYEKGKAYTGSLWQNNDANIAFIYVPHLIKDQANDAFVCDYGYLEIIIKNSWQTTQTGLEGIINKLFDGHAKLMRQVRLNRYYLYRDNYRGPVDFIRDSTADVLIFPPLHKATLNKSVADRQSKTDKDRQLVIDLIAFEKFLYSQDMRLKLGMVPGFVKINWQLIDNTDIGSGQNHLVFLSSGPGINYFDDPWQQERRNVPCPRLIFHRDLANLEKIQLYSTYSIEPDAKGIGRLAAINIFQQRGLSDNDARAKVIWATAEFKTSILTAIEDLLCKYGLANDSPDLMPGFEFTGRLYKGNPVNNEIRASQFTAVRDYLTTVLVPADTAETYLQAYRSKLADSCRHWEYNCGIHYNRLFYEAIESTDKGFRATWLMLQVRESHPTIFRILAKASKSAKPKAFIKIADKISRLAEKAGRNFFLTPYFRHYRNLDKQRTRLWLNYLETCRDGDEKTAAKMFADYTTFYEDLEALCEQF